MQPCSRLIKFSPYHVFEPVLAGRATSLLQPCTSYTVGCMHCVGLPLKGNASFTVRGEIIKIPDHDYIGYHYNYSTIILHSQLRLSHHYPPLLQEAQWCADCGPLHYCTAGFR